MRRIVKDLKNLFIVSPVEESQTSVKESLAKIFRSSNRIFLAQIVLISDILLEIRNQRPKIDPCANFLPNWTKGKGSRISTSNNSQNCMMTSYTRDSDDVIKF